MTGHERLWAELGLDVPLHNRLLESLGADFQAKVESRKNRPRGMAYFDRVIHAAHGDRVAELVKGRAEGRKIVGTFCIYVPEEICLALDLVPLPLCGGTDFSVPYAENIFPRDICPLVKSTLGLAFSKTCPYAPIKSLAVGETTCDAKKKTWEILSERVPFQVMEVPNKKNARTGALWLAEVREFLARMEEVAERTVSADRLKSAIRLMNRKRAALQEFARLRAAERPPISGLDALVVYQGMLNDEPLRFTENLERLNRELESRIAGKVSPFPAGVRRLMVSGCPAVMGNWKIHSIIESCGGAVVADETCTGSRYFENLVDESAGDVDGMVAALAERYLKVDCSCFTPNDERLRSVESMVDRHGIDGVVQYVLQFCHTYNIEAIRVEKTLKAKGIPQIKIETDYSREDSGQITTRIEAFLEKLGSA
ncbi:MAG TPA: double-cubane-cluster-containing anaerobic reductase [Planctomycetota bacterium]|jgi:benzoyl-CoA reductase/2-hydroxyglutaryl-CoA dehydratase subunit BcrC/BadD/HgdB|nr:2-hydroxyacyl-CoA dehydratase [Planctomycetota bacterium]OQC20789.1 MAG: (R)-2-hydroxyglutaryl-CoA dehydratase subunit beta [Planctomycetes bacterium ADurb.Bin069]NMD35454.1 2-hydroxyacyl-CoA dehydratase [Planctomycetota bacterium]HNR99349.1 double-cubane-cluster-containing anaerobic reductase [Planctomycetota bacterium]HNU26817.1 double-cubane-cluster-containing anaerobic reductase [Planctomycetota bacterium]